MNNASVLIIFVLLVTLIAGMVFLVDQLNRSAAEILANRGTIQDLQGTLEEAQTQLSLQQQVIEGQNAALAQKEGELGAARQALQAAQADVSALQQRLVVEQAARTASEQQVSALRADLLALQSQAVASAPVQTPAATQVPLLGAGVGSTSTGLPWAVSAGGLLVAGGALIWGRHERHLALPAAHTDRVVVHMTRAQAHAFVRATRAHSDPEFPPKAS